MILRDIKLEGERKMSRFIIVVLDSFGVGAMDDVPDVRPRDIGANTAWHIIEKKPTIQIPTLEKLGLMNVINKETTNLLKSQTACYGTANLAHYGADSFLGHQEIMGTIPKEPLNQPFNEKINEIEAHLITVGYKVRRVGKLGRQILVVNESATIGDNLETDLGQVYNVSACLELMPFDKVKKLGQEVRSIVQVSRVIAFGGQGIELNDLLKARKIKALKFAGVDAPESGIYNSGYQVVHLGYGIDAKFQLASILDRAGITVSLSGKFADIIQTKSSRIFSEVNSERLFNHFEKEIKEISNGLICLNIQETDLAGHAEDVDRYTERLEFADKRLEFILSLLNKEDLLIIMADHGNDPTIGHSNHTREKVPLLIVGNQLVNGNLGNRLTMADVGATAADFFKVNSTQDGNTFLVDIKK